MAIREGMRNQPRFRRRLIGAAALALALALGAAVATADVETDERDSDTLRVVTYNIKLGGALKLERKFPEKLKPQISIARMFRLSKRLKGPDILSLQEVCSDEGGWQLEYFRKMQEEQSGASHMVFAPAKPDGADFMCDRGQAIFSRYPVVDSGFIQLPNTRQERSATWAEIELPGGERIRVYSVHLEDRPQKPHKGAKGRLLQTQTILAQLLEWKSRHPDGRVLFMGDLNSGNNWVTGWWKPELGILELMKHMDSVIEGYVPTYVMTPYRLDWIFQDGFEVVRSKVIKYPLSDHYPIATDLRLAP